MYSGQMWVLQYKECLELMQFLLHKSLKGNFQFIEHQFTLLRAGDQSLHAEIDCQAASNCLEVQTALSSLGMPTQPMLQEDPEERMLKKLLMLAEVVCMEAEVVCMEKENEEYTLEVAEKNKAVFEQLFGCMDDRDQLVLRDNVMNSMYCPAAKAITNCEGPSHNGRRRQQLTR
eukprot:3457930-Rhodomonas_salina.1